MTDVERVQVPLPEDLRERVLQIAGDRVVLIGGQALAFWAAHFQIPEPVAAITKDADFLGKAEDVDRFARQLGGVKSVPDRRMRTSLIGCVDLSISPTEYVHIDVLFQVFGDISVQAVQGRAYEASISGTKIRVLHPLDVLQCRLENVYGIPEKQDEHGIEQLKVAIEMVRAFVREEDAVDPRISDRPIVLKHISRIERMALSDAGRKVARRFGVFVADAVEFPGLSTQPDFMHLKFPQIVGLMSPSRLEELRKDGLLPPISPAPPKAASQGRRPR